MQENKQRMQKKRTISTSAIVKAALLATISIVLTRFLSLMLVLGGLPALRVGVGSIPLIMSGMMFGPVVGGITGVVADIVGYMINPMGGTYFPGFTVSAALYGVIAGILFKTFKIQNMKINFNLVNAVVMALFGVGLFVLMLSSDTLIFEGGKFIMNDTSALPVIVLMVLVTALFIAIPFAMSSRFKNKIGQLNFDKIAFAVNITYVINALLLNTLWLSIMFDKGFMVFLPGRVIAAVITIPLYTLIIFTLGKFVNLLEQ
ncbi:folate family ECF transporter S component [Fusibacter bizertensis]|jgi:Protein of unknown function (DUF1393).|uniref:Folate family ECF transporter S component n=1 Tax=Fusibacter bizertensis TaxID=1488331 RepID=A0ABT6N9Y4_9FIRM|nr:folate family ECF transporter S component [Fusibacter bizertensis]MDH8677225.1 folate family ECF transporter S component [Fusibacter bizertensis]